MRHRFTRAEVFSIPNLMGYFRILLIPIFCCLYLGAESPGQMRWAAAVSFQWLPTLCLPKCIIWFNCVWTTTMSQLENCN